MIRINAKGHIAFGVFAASVFCWYTQATLTETAVIVAAGIPGALALDLDHRQSTANKPITPFSRKQQKNLRWIASICAFIGVFLLAIKLTESSQWIPYWLQKSSPIWMISAVFLWLLSRFRDVVLFVVGAAVIYAYMVYEWHWFTALLGVSLFILPMLKHRGLLHTPEFVGCVIIALMAFMDSLGVDMLTIAAVGISLGMLSHLVADSLGPEGIQSLLFPRLRMALRLVPAGSRAEVYVSYACWIASLAFVIQDLL